jgi:hypothetical protein
MAGGKRWIPTECYVLPTIIIVMESEPRYWHVLARWLWWGIDIEWAKIGGGR